MTGDRQKALAAGRDDFDTKPKQGELIARLRLTQQQVEAATRAKSEFVANICSG